MRRPRLTRAEINRAYRRVCHQVCEKCGRKCRTSHVYGHIFDCCGIRCAHILRESDLEPIRVYNRAMYAIGTTQTTPESRGRRVIKV